MTKTKKTAVSHGTGKNEENLLTLYMREISKIPLLSKEDEEKYAKLAAEGNMAAREKIVNSNLRFVISIAKKFQGKGLPLEDLISEGNTGLLNAVNRFDIKKGYRFITYAVWWIRQAIIKAVSEKSRMIRLPGNMVNDLTKIQKTREAFLNEQGWKTETEIEKIAEFLEMPAKKTATLTYINQEVLSLDDPTLQEENSMSMKDLVGDTTTQEPAQEAVNSMLKDELDDIINGLENRAAEVIRCRYGLNETGPLTLKEISERYNLSRERVRQIE
jgi:RNA polymerase primary sigma factor